MIQTRDRMDGNSQTGEAPIIRTPDQRVRVFVSSTLDELAPERAAAREAIAQLRLTPVLFESGARPYPPVSSIRRTWRRVCSWQGPSD